MPPVMRKPEWGFSSIRLPPKRTAVPGAPKAPGLGITAGPVVSSGGPASPRNHHSKYSPLIQKRPGGPQAPSVFAAPQSPGLAGAAMTGVMLTGPGSGAGMGAGGSDQARPAVASRTD